MADVKPGRSLEMVLNESRKRREVCCHDRDQWRQWLSSHHDELDEVWLVYYKKPTGIDSVSYAESVEEAICFGWIDGKKRSIDEQRYSHRFSPRRRKSKWTPLNIKRAQKMIKAGLMKPAGLRAYQHRVEYDADSIALRTSSDIQLPAEFEKPLKADKIAWKHFTGLAPGYRKQYILWLTSAKRPQTREKRFREAISLLKANRKLGMK